MSAEASVKPPSRLRVRPRFRPSRLVSPVCVSAPLVPLIVWTCARNRSSSADWLVPSRSARMALRSPLAGNDGAKLNEHRSPAPSSITMESMKPALTYRTPPMDVTLRETPVRVKVRVNDPRTSSMMISVGAFETMLA